jgi:hypothetical protein
MSDRHDDEVLARLLTEQLPPVPADVADPPPAGTLARRARRRWLAEAGAAAAVVGLLAAAGVVVAGHDRSGQTAAGGGVPHVVTDSGAPQGPWVGQQVQQVDTVDLDPDGRTLQVPYSSGDCQNVKVTAVEFPDKVTVRVETRADRRKRVCSLILVIGTMPVRLDRPLGNRPVVDSTTGRTVIVQDRSKLRRPTYLPPGCRIDSGFPESVWTTAAEGGGYTVRIHQQATLPSVPPSPGEQVEPIRTATVHGQTATVELHTIGPKLNPSTGKPYTDPKTGRPYQPTRTVVVTWSEGDWRLTVSISPQDGHPYDRDALVVQSLRIADGLR